MILIDFGVIKPKSTSSKFYYSKVYRISTASYFLHISSVDNVIRYDKNGLFSTKATNVVNLNHT